jgi:hypothetical protein
MNAEQEIIRLLREHGAVWERQRKHTVYRFPDGRIYVVPFSPSDHHSVNNSLSDLRKLLGIQREIHKNPKRTHKSGVGKQLYRTSEVPGPQRTHREQLWPIRFTVPIRKESNNNEGTDT